MNAIRSVRHALTAAFAALMAAAFPASAGDGIVIPFELTSSGHISTPISFGGGVSTYAAIDTGANFAMVDAGDALAAGLRLPEEDADHVDVLGVTGLTPYPVITLPSVQVAEAGFSVMPAALRRRGGLPGPPNIMPALAFEGRVLDFDFAAGEIKVYDGAPQRYRDAGTPLRLRVLDGLLFAKIRLNGRTGWALIDTGSSVTYVNSKFADEAQLRVDRERVEISGSTEGHQMARRLTVRQLTLGEYALSNFRLIVADPPLFEHLGMADEPAMVLGLDALSNFRVQIDRHRNRLYLSRPEGKRGVSVIRRIHQ